MYAFPQDMKTCKGCIRRLSTPTRRSALSETVMEVDIPTFDNDMDVDVFLRENQARIIEILQEALNVHP